MKKYSRILIIANLILLLGYFNWSVYQKEQTLKEGQLVLLQLAPVDPRSLMQGDYMRLNYKEANSELINRQEAKRGYAVLKLDKNHVGEIIRLQESLEPVNSVLYYLLSIHHKRHDYRQNPVLLQKRRIRHRGIICHLSP